MAERDATPVEDTLLTRDTMFDGAVSCRQYRDGYRFSVDAVLAAQFLKPARGAEVLDLGAGCGIIGLIVMYRWGHRISRVHGLELQPRLQELARRNLADNQWGETCRCLEGDVLQILDHFPPESVDQVICNPPFYKCGNGRPSGNEQARIARHQLSANLDDFAAAAAAVVRNGGSVVFIYPADRFIELVTALSAHRLECKRVRFVYSYPEPATEARLVLVHALKNGGQGLKVASPLYLYRRKEGEYSDEVQRLYSANESPLP